MLGFRLPSTELNSSILMKIVGYHTKDDSTVIVPKEVIPIAGSDFDIDSLFVVVRERVTDTATVVQPIDFNIEYKRNQDGVVNDIVLTSKENKDIPYYNGAPVGYYKQKVSLEDSKNIEIEVFDYTRYLKEQNTDNEKE